MMDTCRLTVMIPSQAVSRPLAGQQIQVSSLLGVEFAGYTVTVEEQQNAVQSQLDYVIDCRDFGYLLDRHLAFAEFAQDSYTYDQIVKALVTMFAADDGFTLANVQSSYEAEYTRFDYQPTAQSIQSVAQTIAWAFYVDYQKGVWFYDGTVGIPTPLPSNTLNADTATTVADSTYGRLGVYGDLKIREDVSQLRNRIFLYGHQVTANEVIPQTFTGDGQTTSFGLTYPPSQDLVNNVTVTVGGVNYIVKTDLVDGAPTTTIQDFTAYINFVGQTVRFNVAPADGVQIVIDYRPQFPLVQVAEDKTAQAFIAARMGLSSGEFEFAISDPTLSAETIGPAVARGQEELAKYAYPHFTGSFSSYLHGWRAGTFFLLTSANRMDGQLNGATFYVTKVEKKLIAHPTVSGTTQPLFKSTISFSDTVYSV